MSEARAFQQRFGELLAHGSGTRDTRLQRALAVHRNTAAKAAQEALAANYPVLRALVGDEAFAAISGMYTEQRPPTDPRLCLYGDRFDKVIDAYEPFMNVPYLSAVATVERMVCEALFAADDRPLNPMLLSEGIDPDLPLCRHAATRLAVLSWPAASLWQAHQDEAPLDALEHIEWVAETVLVTRPGAAVQVQAIDKGAAAFLNASTLGAAAVAAAEIDGDVGAIFAFLLTASAFAHPLQ